MATERPTELPIDHTITHITTLAIKFNHPSIFDDSAELSFIQPLSSTEFQTVDDADFGCRSIAKVSLTNASSLPPRSFVGRT